MLELDDKPWFENDHRATLMRTTLGAAIPMWGWKWDERLLHWTDAQVIARAQELGQIVAEKGDVIQFKGKKPGESAFAFNALAEGLALLARCPGGVKFLGDHWEIKVDRDLGQLVLPCFVPR